MSDGQGMLKVAIIGAGKLTLGHIVPALNHRNTEITLLLRSFDPKDGTSTKTVLHEKKQYVRHFTDDPTNEETFQFHNVLTYAEVDQAYWEDVNIIITSVGTKNYQSAAKQIADIFRRRRSTNPVCLMAFENDDSPADTLLEKTQAWYRNLNSRDQVLFACNVAVDSMCDARLDQNKRQVVANGQRHSDTVVLAKNDYCENIIRRAFKNETNFKILSADKPHSEDIMHLLEKKKAWFVNALDYIVAANSLKRGSYVMTVDDETLDSIEGFCETASKVLDCMCNEYGLNDDDRDMVLGPNSFLGTCASRKEATIANIRSEVDENGIPTRKCYKVLSDLGIHSGICAYFDTSSGIFNDSPHGNQPASSAFEKAMVDFEETLNTAIEYKEESKGEEATIKRPLSVNRDAIYNGALNCMADLYVKTNIAMYLAKIRQRLILVPPAAACDDGLVDSKQLAHVAGIIEEHLDVAHRQLLHSLDGVERALINIGDADEGR